MFNLDLYLNDLQRTLLQQLREDPAHPFAQFTGPAYWQYPESLLTRYLHDVYPDTYYCIGEVLHSSNASVTSAQQLGRMLMYGMNCHPDRVLLAYTQGASPEFFQTTKRIVCLNMVQIERNISDVFEQCVPQLLNQTCSFNSRHGVFMTRYTELTGLSLLCKKAPRHRVRVIKCTYTLTGSKTITTPPIEFVQYCFLISQNSLMSKQPLDNVPANIVYPDTFLATIPLLYADLTSNEEPMTELQTQCVQWFTELSRNYDLSKLLENVSQYLNTCPATQELILQHTKQNLQTVFEMRSRIQTKRLQALTEQCDTLLQRYMEALAACNTLQRTQLIDMSTDILDTVANLCQKQQITDMSCERMNSTEEQWHFTAHAFVTNYSQQDAKHYYKHRVQGTTSDFAKLFKACFIDETYMLKFVTPIEVGIQIHENTNATTVSYKCACERRTHILLNNIVNPHHAYFNCWGNYGPSIAKQLEEGQYDLACCTILTAVGSLNMCDSIVMGHLGEVLQSAKTQHIKCIALRDDPENLLTIKEVLDQLKTQEGAV